MNILILGNLGYVGSKVVSHLRKTIPNATITGFDTAYFGAAISCNLKLADSLCDRQYYGDIRDIDPNFLDQFDVFVFLAAISNDPMGNKFEQVTYEINQDAQARIIKHVSARAGITIVFASSCSVYGQGGNDYRTEGDQVNPLTAYARSKIFVEGVLDQCSWADSSKATALRFATACGVSDRIRLDLVLNDFVASALVNKKVEVLSDGSPWRPLIDVRDMARAVEWAIVRPIETGSEYLIANIGRNDWNYQIKDLAVAVCEHVPGAELQINTNAAPDTRSYQVDFSFFKQIAPAHQPIVSLDETICELRDYLSDRRPVIGSNFRSSKFIRLEMLNDLIRNEMLTARLRWIN